MTTVHRRRCHNIELLYRKYQSNRTMKLCILSLLAVLGTAAAFSITTPPSASSTESVDRRSFIRFSAGAAAATATAGLALPAFAAEDQDFITTESGLQYKITKEGTGAVPIQGANIKAHYTGWLDGFDSDKKFDSSRDRGRAFSFKVGAGQVIRGWDEAFSAMAVGERRQIIIPPRLGYGDRGAGGVIPGGATLYFDVELLAIQ
jgi:peptidylprolyl isomerase